jgi:elongation factor P--(R)-beta-lysine ligase
LFGNAGHATMATMRVLAPSDLRGVSPGEVVRVGGRVLAIDAGLGGQTLHLADAFAIVAAILPADVPVALGDLVVLEGAARGGELEGARLVSRSTPEAPLVVGELARTRTHDALRRRAEVVTTVRAFFAERDFLEVETPVAVPSPGLDLHLDAFEVPGLGYLGTSPEYQMKRLLAGGVPRSFQIARCFRRGEIGHRHNPEFTMLEWYRAFAGVEEVIDDTEALVKRVLSGFDRRAVVVDGVHVDVARPFERITVADAFARWAGTTPDDMFEMAERDEDRFFRLLVDAVEPGLAGVGGGVFLTMYPAKFASLARLSPADPRVAERFELYVGGLELCNGFGELTDPREQRARFERDQAERRAANKPIYPIDERFLAALREGMPPAAGNALGLDRLVALALGANRISEVIAFPHSWL